MKTVTFRVFIFRNFHQLNYCLFSYLIIFYMLLCRAHFQKTKHSLCCIGQHENKCVRLSSFHFIKIGYTHQMKVNYLDRKYQIYRLVILRSFISKFEMIGIVRLYQIVSLSSNLTQFAHRTPNYTYFFQKQCSFIGQLVFHRLSQPSFILIRIQLS